MPFKRLIRITTVTLSLSLPGAGCQHDGPGAPPPDARRPVLKTESELASQRQEAIQAGEIEPKDAPRLEAEKKRFRAGRPVRERRALPPGQIQTDILLVNDESLSVDEVLYPLRQEVRELHAEDNERAFVEQTANLVRRRVREEIGGLLVYKEAMSGLNEEQKKGLDSAVEQEVQRRVSNDFGGSLARFDQHLHQYGLTLDRMRELVKRSLVVQSYTRQKFTPQVFVSRSEILEHYREHGEELNTPETRELRMIEVPYQAFVPAGQDYQNMPSQARAPARLAALRQARAAHEALGARPFEEVAREYSNGAHAAEGGSWGQIGKPLQSPYDEASKQIFSFAQGQISPVIETPNGYVIVQCGKIVPATAPTLAEAQEMIRERLMDERYARLANEYVLRLATKATFSSMETFVATAVQRAAGAPWLERQD